MKKMLLVLLGIVLALFLFLLIKTFAYPFTKADNQSPVQPVSVMPAEKAIMRLSGGIKFPTIINEVYEETDFAPFEGFKNYLRESYPVIYETMDTMTINNYGLVFRWKGKNSQLNPVLFLSHYDVVPVVGYEPDTDDDAFVYNIEDKNVNIFDQIQEDWEYPAFSGAVANGRIYGRGSLDMKNMLFSIMESAEDLINSGFQPERDIWIAFGQDEERSGLQGAVKIAEYFNSQNMTFDAVFDEGGIITAPKSVMDNINRPMALVGLGEKGFLTLRIKVKGIGGHSSMPPEKGSLVYAAEIIQKLNENQMPARLITPINSFLNNVGGEMSFVSRMAIANKWLMKPILLNSLSGAPGSNALIRSTTAVTMAKGSDAPNVLSSVSEVTVNFRLLQGDSVRNVIEHVEKICEGYDVEIEVAASREPSTLTPDDTETFARMTDIIHQLYPDAIVSSYITIGGTDAYKYQIVSDKIYRFMPVLLNEFEQRTIHNENESITLENYGRMIYYFTELMRGF